MVTSSSPARREDGRCAARRSSDTGRRARVLAPTGVAVALFFAALLSAAPAQCVDLAAGVAVPRGFYDYAVAGHGELTLYKGGVLPPFVSVSGRLSGYVSYRDQIGLGVGSASILAKLTAPEAMGGRMGFRPYVSVGPSFNYQYSWADLDDFGTLSEHKTSTTTSVFVGADFFSRSRFTFFIEARQTLPSDFTFDYAMFGIKYAGPILPDIE